MECAPAALFVYNRPEHTRRTVEALLRNPEASNTDLIVFSDAPRAPKAAEKVREVRDYVRTIQGFKSLTVEERTRNAGVRASIIEGVTQLCRKRGRVIVLEDDLLTSPHFLEFMNAGLERSDRERRVMQVSGHSFPISIGLPEDAILLPFTTSWGWATWDRAWRHFDAQGSGYERLAGDKSLKRRFDLYGGYRFFDLLTSQRQGKVDSWAILWYLSVFLQEGLGLFPRKTLVRNIGLDGSGVNRFRRSVPGQEENPDFRVSRLPERAEPSPLSETVLRGFFPGGHSALVSLVRRLLLALSPRR